MSNQKIVTEAALSAIASDIKNALSGKANSNDVYTKTEIDSALALKADKATTYTKTETDAALALKANASEVEDIRIGANGKTYASAGDAVRGQITDVQNEINIIDNILNGETIKTVTDWISNQRIGNNGALIASGADYYVTDFIELNSAYQIEYSAFNFYDGVEQLTIAFYDVNKTFIANSGSRERAQTITEYPEGAVYVRFCTLNRTTYPIGDAKAYLYYGKNFNDLDNQISDIENDIDNIENVIVTDKSAQFVNILEGYNTCENLKFLVNGQLTANNNWVTLTDYIPVTSEAVYGINYNATINVKQAYRQIKVAWYAADKSFISELIQTNNLAYTAPSNAAYCRMSKTNSNYSSADTDNFDNFYMQIASDGNGVHCIDAKDYFTHAFPLTTLSGKTWGLFGDSITEKNIRANVNYHDYIRVETGVITTNYALGGSGYKNRDDNGNAFYQIAYRNKDDLSNCDFITIMGGVNDCTRGAFDTNLGTVDDVFVGDDMEHVTNNSICACLKKLLDIIIENAPLTRIAVISPLPAVTAGFTFNPNDDTNNMSRFVEAEKTICNMYGIPFLDLYHSSGLRPWDNTMNTAFFLCNSSDSPDRLHPNEFGQKYIYPAIREFIKTLS